MVEGKSCQQGPWTKSPPSASLCLQNIDQESFSSPQRLVQTLPLRIPHLRNQHIWQKLRDGFKRATSKHLTKLLLFSPSLVSQALLHSPWGTHNMEQVLDKRLFLRTSASKTHFCGIMILCRSTAGRSHQFPEVPSRGNRPHTPNLATAGCLLPPIPLGIELNASRKSLLYDTKQMSLFNSTGVEKENPPISRKE